MRKSQPGPSSAHSTPHRRHNDEQRRKQTTFLNHIPLWSSKIPIASASADSLDQEIHPNHRRRGDHSRASESSRSSILSDGGPESLALTNVSCDYLVDTLPQGKGFDESLDKRYRDRISQHRISLPGGAEGPSEKPATTPRKKINAYAPPASIPRRSSSRMHLHDSIDERLARSSLDTKSPSYSSGPPSGSAWTRQSTTPSSFPQSVSSSPRYSKTSSFSYPSSSGHRSQIVPQNMPALYPGIPEDPERYTDPRVSALSPYHRVLNKGEDGKLHMNVSYAEAQMLLSVRKRRLALQEQESHNGWVHALEDELKELQETFGIAGNANGHADPKCPDRSRSSLDTRFGDIRDRQDRPHSEQVELESVYGGRFGFGRAI